jgi:hypothetical protein
MAKHEAAAPTSARPVAAEARAAAPRSDTASAVRPGGEAEAPVPGQPSPARKIIRNGELEIVVPSCSTAGTAIERLTTQAGGFVADTRLAQEDGEVSRATYVLRLPAEGLDGALGSIRALGKVVSERLTAEDVTEQYADLEARLANAKAAEARLVRLLADRTAALADVLQVERELTRVRENVEVIEGKLRFLARRVDLATLTVNLRMESRYVAAPEPTFGGRLTIAWRDSIEALGSVTRGLAIAFVVLLPWLVPVGLIGGFIAWLLRRAARKREEARLAIPPAPLGPAPVVEAHEPPSEP